MFSMKRALFYIILVSALTGCEYLHQRQAGTAVVTVEGQSLYLSDLEEVTSGATTKEDSTTIANNYIRQWATDVLLYSRAKRSSENASTIEALVEDYRRTLYVHEYEQYLVDTRMPKQVEDDSVLLFYQRYADRFLLRETILSGMFISLPNDAPHIEDLHKWMEDLNDEHLEKIEKYAYQYATAYELFSDQWQTLHNVMLRMPTASKELEQDIRKNNFVQYQDSAYVYLLRITDKHLAGEPMPIEYARPEIEKVLLNKRQVQFLQKQKEELYRQAIRQNKIVFNTQTQEQ